MSKRKATKRQKAQEKKPKTVAKKPSRFLLILKSFLSYSLIILTIISTVYFFSPKISLSTKNKLAPNDSITTPFIISNESELPIYDIEFLWEFKKGMSQNVRLINVRTAANSVLIPDLKSREKATVFINYPFGGFKPLKTADLIINISYRPKFLFFKQTKRFRYVIFINNKEEPIWLPKAISEK